MFILRDMQKEQEIWADKNFPGNKMIHPLVGIIEEVGELAHVVLKETQTIRYTPDVVIAKKKDAVSDIMIFLAHYCTKNSFTMPEIQVPAQEMIHVRADQHRMVLNISKIVGDAAQDYLLSGDESDFKWRVRSFAVALTVALDEFSAANGFSMMNAVEETWSQVKSRDWKKNPTDANVIAEAAAEKQLSLPFDGTQTVGINGPLHDQKSPFKHRTTTLED